MHDLTITVCLLLATAPGLLAADSASTQTDLPNIVYILCDDAGYGDFGCYGQQTLKTPNVDRLAAEGMRFTRHYAGCTVCAPSRCVLMTGLHTGHCRVRGNSPGLMQDRDMTIAEILRDAGYATACCGKWGIGSPPPDDDPGRNGFDHFFGYVNMFHAHNFYPAFLYRNGEREMLRNVLQDQWKDSDGRGVAVERIDYAPDLIANDALAFIDKHQSQPFFLYYALNIPHANNEGGRHSDRPEKGMEVPDFGPYADHNWPATEKGFATMIHNIDRDVGRIIAKLKETGIDDRTLVMFSSDNGPHQEGGHQAGFFDSNGPLRGTKRDLYEGGIRVPFICRWPETVTAGTTSHHISGFQDILPTLADIADQATPGEVDGISLMPTLSGSPEDQEQHDYLYWEFSEQGGKRALIQGDLKVVQANLSRRKPDTPELYSLSDDLSEENDLATQHPETVARLVKLMDDAHEPSDAYPLTFDEKQPAN